MEAKTPSGPSCFISDSRSEQPAWPDQENAKHQQKQKCGADHGAREIAADDLDHAEQQRGQNGAG